MLGVVPCVKSIVLILLIWNTSQTGQDMVGEAFEYNGLNPTYLEYLSNRVQQNLLNAGCRLNPTYLEYLSNSFLI